LAAAVLPSWVTLSDPGTFESTAALPSTAEWPECYQLVHRTADEQASIASCFLSGKDHEAAK
jgi:hypothetical protein